MTASKFVTIWCDGADDGLSCVEFVDTGEHENARARQIAKREGWAYQSASHAGAHNGRDFCPAHSGGS